MSKQTEAAQKRAPRRAPVPRSDRMSTSAIIEAYAAGLIRPAYKSMRDFQRTLVYRFEHESVAPYAPSVTRDGVQSLVDFACKRYRLMRPEIRFSDRMRGGGWYRIGHGIVLGLSGMDEMTVLHECAHHIVGVHFGDASFRKGENERFEPSHGPWFTSVAFDLYNQRGIVGSMSGDTVLRVKGAVAPTSGLVPEMIKQQSAIWFRFFRTPEQYTIIDPDEMSACLDTIEGST